MDLLSEILEIVKLRGTIYFHARFQSPWGMQVPQGRSANFHIVTQGQCWLLTDSESRHTALHKGDIVLFLNGDQHSLVDSLQTDSIPASELLKNAHDTESNEIVFGGDGCTSSSLICGHFDFDRQFQHSLFQSLPDFLHVCAKDNSNADWFITASELATKISSSESPGKDAVLNKMAESLFIQILADYVKSLDDSSSFLAAIQDRKIGRALKSIHNDIAHDWSIAELADIASMSKSVFSLKFHSMVGEPPIIYLAKWRMLKAREMLKETTLPISLISEKVGYQSEFSFSKAFKKLTGQTPGALRKAASA